MFIKRFHLSGVIIVGIGQLLLNATTVQAQSIVADPNGTGTVVIQDGNQFNIDAGTLSRDGQNLFHSLEQFGLEPGQIANFLANPQIENILTRVVGGNPSLINGLIQITGSNANLYLMNPAGIIFGTEAQLNITGDFFATTATQIGFEEQTGFNAFGSNDYQNLVGTPSTFDFDLSQPGSIVNRGDLTLSSGGNLTFLGGHVINQGTLSTPGGNITIATIPGTNRVKISQPGHLLSLEIEPLQTPEGELIPFTPADLPALLTGGDDDTVGGLVAGELNTSSDLKDGGNITLATVNQDITAQTLNASSRHGNGGHITAKTEIGNITTGDIFSHAGVYLVGDNLTPDFSSDNLFGRGGTISFQTQTGNITTGDIHAFSGINLIGNNITAQSPTLVQLGQGGDISLTTQSGNIITEQISLFSSVGKAGDNINFPAPEFLDNGVRGGNITLSIEETGTIDINGKILTFSQSGDGGDVLFTTGTGEIDTEQIVNTFSRGAGGTAGDITFTVEETGNITTGKLVSIGRSMNDEGEVDGGNITLSLQQGNITTGELNTVGQKKGRGGDIRVSVLDDGDITLGNLFTSSLNNHSGNVEITTSQGNITTAIVRTLSEGKGDGGNILIESQVGNIITRNLNAFAIRNGSGGDIQVFTGVGNIELGQVQTFSGGGNGGDIEIFAQSGDIITNNLLTFSREVGSTAGNIRVSSNAGNIEIQDASILTYSVGDGGDIFIETPGNLEIEEIFTGGGFRDDGTNAATARNAAGEGGDLVVTVGRLLRVTDVFIDQNGVLASISTAGTEGGGDLTIRFDTLFIVGDPSTSGTAGAITTGEVTILPSQLFFFPHQDGNLDISPLSPPIFNPNHLGVASDSALLEDPIASLEQEFEQEFKSYFGQDFTARPVNTQTVQLLFKNIELQTETRTALIYANPTPEGLQLLLMTPEGFSTKYTLPEVDETKLEVILTLLHNSLRTPKNHAYLPLAQTLYQWLISPLESQLQESNIDTLIFSMGSHLRLLPLPVLHDGQQYLIEKYHLSTIPSLGLTNTLYQSLEESSILAMGASQFPHSHHLPLPAVPLELAAISDTTPVNNTFLNEDFTLENLELQRLQRQPDIIHLATHVDFLPQDHKNSYIQFWDQAVNLEEFRTIMTSSSFNKDNRLSSIELLVLSGCETAVGNYDAEMGFAGLALQTGVKSTLASLWPISDGGTLPLMTEFYHHLMQSQGILKTEALRHAQLAMINGEITIESEQLRTPNSQVQLPQSLQYLEGQDLSHPYYWGGFTLIGSPW